MSVVMETLPRMGRPKTKENTSKRWSDGEGMCLGLQIARTIREIHTAVPARRSRLLAEAPEEPALLLLGLRSRWRI